MGSTTGRLPGSSADTPVQIEAARVLLFDERGRLLLFFVDNPAAPERRGWIAPGGGLEPGETFEAAARRELFEETGIDDAVVSDCVHEDEELFLYEGVWICKRQQYFVARADSARPIDLSRHTSEERRQLTAHKWWPMGDLKSSREPIPSPELLPLAIRVAGTLSTFVRVSDGRPGSSRENPLTRPGSRVVLLDAANRVLLFRVRDPHRPEREPAWILPGGGIEGDETHEQCARREVIEETGIEDVELGPCVWLRDVVWLWGKVWIRGIEQVFVGRTASGIVSNHLQLEHEIDFLADHRWWTLEELEGLRERAFPPGLPALVAPLIAGAWPSEPVQVT